MKLERVLALFLAIKMFDFIKHRNVFHKRWTEQNARRKGNFGDSHFN